MSERTEALLRRAAAVHMADGPAGALHLYREILRLDPADFRALHLAGAAAFQLERMEESAGLLSRALGIMPRSAPTLVCYGLACAGLGRADEAEASLKAGVALDPANPEAWVNLAGFYVSTGRNLQAVNCFRRTLKLRHGYAPAFAGLGEVLKSEGRAADAIALYQKALGIDPGSMLARLGLMQCMQSCNRLDESLAECDRILALDPGHMRAASSRLFLLGYRADVDTGWLREEHLAYGRRLAPAPARAFANTREPQRRLRVAFLSPDLRAHSVAFFLQPLLDHLDPALFEVILYHDHVRFDGVSESLRSRSALWRNLAGFTDAAAESVILADSPDVLVDLAGHSGQNRLPLLSRRVAPVQVTYLGYPNTTGLAEMDYRFTDATADPPGEADRGHTETLVRFSPCAWAYAPSAEVRAAGSVPAPGAGEGIAFGSFNNLCKVNAFTLGLWGQVLREVPGSRLVLKGFGMDPGRLGAVVAAAGIDISRVRLLNPSPGIASHLACYGQVDIALDPFPYAGTTTTCEALWMGRPVVTLCGDRHSSRVGASLLSAVGRPEWIARDAQDYVRIAAGLASDRNALGAAGARLRGAMEASALLDHPGQAQRFGAGLRSCWAQWCSGRGRGTQGAMACA